MDVAGSLRWAVMKRCENRANAAAGWPYSYTFWGAVSTQELLVLKAYQPEQSVAGSIKVFKTASKASSVMSEGCLKM